MNDQIKEHKPASVPTAEKVPPAATQAGDILGRWSWVELTVWTPRMLRALEQGVKGGKWFSLMDKVFSRHNLFSAFQRVAGNKGAAGVDHVSIEQFEDRLVPNINTLVMELSNGTYVPQSIRRVWIPKPGSKEKRPLGIPTVRDRVVQTALRNVLEPIFERDFAEHSYGFRPGRGCHNALLRVDGLLKSGYRYVVDADLKSYFDTIPHQQLLERIGAKVSDGRVLELIEAFLKQGVLDGLEEYTPETGSPQGAVISPLLSNIYLDPLDHLMAQRGWEMIRYADDFVILCRTAEEAEEALGVVRQWTAEAGLELHPTKTKIVDTSCEGFDFLGYRFEEGRLMPSSKSQKKLEDTIRSKTKRSNGTSLQCIIANVNRTLRGWYAYFKHCHWWAFDRIDPWIRGRLRSILRKRMKKKGRARGADNQRWRNAFFAKQGLFSMLTAHELATQPARR